MILYSRIGVRRYGVRLHRARNNTTVIHHDYEVFDYMPDGSALDATIHV